MKSAQAGSVSTIVCQMRLNLAVTAWPLNATRKCTLINRGVMELILTNNKRVEVSQEEVSEFITQILVPNPYWRHSGLLTEERWARFLKGESTRDELNKVARYILIYMENLSFTAYLFDKADGELERTREFNMPVIKKLRELYQKIIDNSHKTPLISQLVNEMENTCLEIGADPL